MLSPKNGSGLAEQAALLRVALDSHPGMARVLWGLDQNAFHVPNERMIPETEFPRYLFGGFSMPVVEKYLFSWDASNRASLRGARG